MEILCPSCQKRVTIADEHAGKVMRCPLCQGMFTAPSLPPPAFTPAPATPVPQPVEMFQPISEPAPPPPPPPPSPAREPEPVPAAPSAPPLPPPPPGEYRRSFSIRLLPHILVWIAPVCLVLLFLFSFFPWIHIPIVVIENANRSLWGMAFGAGGSAGWVLYLLFTFFLGLPLIIAAFLFATKFIPAPKPLQPWMWVRPALVLGLLLPGLLIIGWFWLYSNFTVSLMTGWMKLAFRIHLLAVIATALEWWVDRRRAKNLPPPKVELHW